MCALRADSAGNYTVRVASPDDAFTNEYFTLNAYITSDPDEYEANQWIFDADDKNFGPKNSARYNRFANTIGTSASQTAAIQGLSFDTDVDADIYPVAVNPGDKLSVSMDMFGRDLPGDYSISFRINFNKYGEGTGPDGVTNWYYTSYDQFDCANSRIIKPTGGNKNSYASYIVPDNYTGTCYIVVQLSLIHI